MIPCIICVILPIDQREVKNRKPAKLPKRQDSLGMTALGHRTQAYVILLKVVSHSAQDKNAQSSTIRSLRAGVSK